MINPREVIETIRMIESGNTVKKYIEEPEYPCARQEDQNEKFTGCIQR